MPTSDIVLVARADIEAARVYENSAQCCAYTAGQVAKAQRTASRSRGLLSVNG